MKMCLPFVTIVLTTVVVVVQNHECKDYVLSASDQSLIDIMKHYLHTSRRVECPQPGKTSNTGVTYVRWGKKSCPTGSKIVYTGQVGGNGHERKGGGVNYLCLPNDPENGQHQSYDNNQVHGGEYELGSSMQPSGWSESMHNKEVPCAVCYKQRRSAVLIIPGRKTCYKGWNAEYNVFLMSDHV
ncbi:short-chain collagen C4-like [Mytilus californianus]|uniref:short-chain collagen C4-like n=1 Tax=Mytilus californianus TaxID=6549 RepID=UPI002245004B|nr:short-chain collagen C4-like [Mytilus californianus]